MMNILKIISACNLDVDRYCQLNDKRSYIFSSPEPKAHR